MDKKCLKIKLGYLLVLILILCFICAYYNTASFSKHLITQNNKECSCLNITTRRPKPTEKSLNVTTKYQETVRDAREIPNVIIQYGQPRTSSTLQYQILCLMMIMLHENEVNSVGCSYHRKPSQKYSVSKTHDIPFLLALPQNAWIFMTTQDKQSSEFKKTKNITEKNKRKVRYIVDSEMVKKQGYLLAYKYQSIFGISDAQMSHIITYLRYWEILRRCCGKQMSFDWRNQLTRIPGYKQHASNQSMSYPACEMYDISRVEKLFINTIIYKRLIRIASINDTIGKPSTVDGKLDGTYCKRCNKNIIKRGLHKINKNCA